MIKWILNNLIIIAIFTGSILVAVLAMLWFRLKVNLNYYKGNRRPSERQRQRLESTRLELESGRIEKELQRQELERKRLELERRRNEKESLCQECEHAHLEDARLEGKRQRRKLESSRLELESGRIEKELQRQELERKRLELERRLKKNHQRREFKSARKELERHRIEEERQRQEVERKHLEFLRLEEERQRQKIERARIELERRLIKEERQDQEAKRTRMELERLLNEERQRQEIERARLELERHRIEEERQRQKIEPARMELERLLNEERQHQEIERARLEHARLKKKRQHQKYELTRLKLGRCFVELEVQRQELERTRLELEHRPLVEELERQDLVLSRLEFERHFVELKCQSQKIERERQKLERERQEFEHARFELKHRRIELERQSQERDNERLEEKWQSEKTERERQEHESRNREIRSSCDDGGMENEDLKLGKTHYSPPEFECVEFAVFAPRSITPSCSFVLDVWAYLPNQYSSITAFARELGRDSNIGRKCGVPVTRGAILTITINIEKLEVQDPIDMVVWESVPTNASFIIKVPSDCPIGKYAGKTVINYQGIAIAKIAFLISVETHEAREYMDHSIQTLYPKSAFASYASGNREEVLSRIQGMKKVAPELDIFIDVFTLRSGQNWQEKLEQHVPTKDKFYLFWSQLAARSEWVEREWRLALFKRGLDYIDPVPLEEPDRAKPPQELSALHFSDAYLLYIKSQRLIKQMQAGRES